MEVRYIKKKTIVVLSSAVLGLVLLGGSTAFAQTPSVGMDSMQSLVTKISQRFNIPEADVEQVFNEHRDEMHLGMRTKLEERLTALVQEGTLTDVQKQAIIAKVDEMAADHEALRQELKDKTPEERRAVIKQHRTELEAWAQENGISDEVMKLFTFKAKMGRHGGIHKM